MLQLRRLAPALARNGGSLREVSTTALLQGPPKKGEKKESEEGYELLPPGSSIADPTYGLSVSDPVYFYDGKKGDVAGAPPATGAPRKAAAPPPPTPTNLAAAQQKLKDQKDAKGKKDDEEEEPYVYLPPGSSMREPGYNSMSDPIGGRIYYRDPTPIVRRK